MKKHFLFIILSLALIAGKSSATVYTGVCGEHLTWSYDTETAHMTIEGYGELKNTVDSLWWKQTGASGLVMGDGLQDLLSL